MEFGWLYLAILPDLSSVALSGLLLTAQIRNKSARKCTCMKGAILCAVLQGHIVPDPALLQVRQFKLGLGAARPAGAAAAGAAAAPRRVLGRRPRRVPLLPRLGSRVRTGARLGNARLAQRRCAPARAKPMF